jgi:hypothetical protein
MQDLFSTLIVLLFTVHLLAPGAALAAECTPTADYWFLEEYAINSLDPPLPADIRIETFPLDRRGSLRISNHGQDMLYLLPRGAYPEVVVAMRGEGVSEALAEDEPVSQTVFLPERAPGVASALIEPGQAMVLDIDNIPALVDDRLEDHNIRSETRSSFISVPPPLRTELYLVYDEQIYEVTFTVRYRVNMGFEGKACEPVGEIVSTPSAQLTAQSPPEASLAGWVMGGLLVYFLGVMAYSGVKLLRKS